MHDIYLYKLLLLLYFLFDVHLSKTTASFRQINKLYDGMAEYSKPLPEISLYSFQVFEPQGWLLFTAVICTLCGIVVYYKIRQTKINISLLEFQKKTIQNQKDQLERLTLKVQQKPLFSQLNPHLVFNSLTAVQNFVMMDDKKMANYYFGLLSGFIRQMLHNGNHAFIKTETEKKLVTDYLQLEQVRFNHKFSYHCEFKGPCSYIPSMLVFPFIEEALYKRVLASDPDHEIRHLNIIFESSENETTVMISDDGIVNRKEEQSPIILLAEEQIADLNNYHREKISIERNYARANNHVNIRIPHSILV